MREQFLPDGSKNYGQGVIGPSAQDIAFFNNPDRSPLDHFPTRQALTTTAIIITPFAVSGCISVTPAKTEEVQQSADNETSLSGEISIGDRFDAFLTLYNDKQTEIGVVDAWIDALGIPKSAIEYDDTYNFLSNPLEATTAYFNIAPNDGNIRPSKGDIAVISPTSDYANGILGIATGEQENLEGNLYEKVLMHYNGNPNIIDLFNPYEILAWLKPKDIVKIDGEGDQGNDVLVARAESISDHFQSFKDRYDGQFVEKNDISNLNQCMDLVTAWADELGIPRDAVTGLLYAKNLYLTPKQITKDYFEIIPYKSGDKPRIGDIVVWDEGIGGVAGHAAISNGDSSANEWLSTFSQNYPTGTESHMEDFNFDHILGWLRPKGFRSNPEPTNTPAIPEFTPETPLNLARYQFSRKFFDSLSRNYKEDDGGFFKQNIELDEVSLEAIIQSLAKGEEVTLDNPIEYRWSTLNTYYGSQHVGIAYFNKLSISEKDSWNYYVSDADKANGIEYKGYLELSGIVKFGVRTGNGVKINDKSEFDKISNFSSWIDGYAHALTITGPNYDYVAECGDGTTQPCISTGAVLFDFFSLPYGTNREGAPGFEKVE